MTELTPRQRAILLTVVERYIESGEPISSAAVVASASSGNGSSATVRNELAALTEAGYLEQPHTSAGRIPTAPGFRVFVESLGPVRPGGLSERSRHEIDARFADVAGTQAVLERTSQVLATLSSGVGLAIASVPGSDQLEHVHFSRLAQARVLAVVVTRGGIVRDRLLTLDEDLSSLELGSAANFLNENFRGWEIERIRAELRSRVETEREAYQQMANAAEQLWMRAVPQPSAGDGIGSIYIEGMANLIGSQRIAGADDRERLREMLSALEAKQRLIGLLNAYIDTRQESVRVIFDLENQAPEMAGLVLIATPARLAGQACSTIAVLGPKRIDYERTRNAVGYLAQVVERQTLPYR